MDHFSKAMEDLPGFGGFEDFQGFPKGSLVEDCIEYSLYLLPTSLDSSSTTKSSLSRLKEEITPYIAQWVNVFIWQSDPFELQVVEKNGHSCLYGQTKFGDSIDDEWFIIFLLREISRKYPQLWIRATDTDGEFLLIEAAHAIPSWLSPEVAEFRVWINSGKLLLIPQSQEDRKATKAGRLQSLDENNALKFLRTSSEKMLHLQVVEEEAFYRIARYPEALKEHFHHALVTVPRSVAMILKELPSSVSLIVETVYMRDPKSLRICNTMPNFPPRDPVDLSVKFTKILYAQIKQQVLSPPRPFILPAHESPKFPASELGMKLACGLEMMVAEKNKSPRGTKEVERVLELLKADKLPSDEEIAKWDKRVDDENWLDVDYQEFDADLSGRGNADKSGAGAFEGDQEQQDKIKKMVENFQKFMNDEKAGIQGAEFSDDDDDGDVSTESDEEDEEEHKEGSFDEKEFAKLMREMMGFPAETQHETQQPIEEVSDDDDDENSIRQTMAKMEQELVEAGAIERDRPGADTSFIYDKKGKTKGKQRVLKDDDDDADIDYVIAKNMLESLKSQGAMAGPAGNLLSSMGIKMPRDEADEDEDDDTNQKR